MTETPEWPGKTETHPPAAPVYPPPSPYAYPPGPYPGAYPPPPMPYGDYAMTPAPRNGLGIAALVTAIVALVGSFSVVAGIVLGLVAVVLGFFGRSRVKRGEANNGGIALAGIVLGVIAIIAGLVFIAVWVGVFRQVGASDYFNCLQEAGQDRAKVQLCSDEFRQSVESRFSQTRQPSR